MYGPPNCCARSEHEVVPENFDDDQKARQKVVSAEVSERLETEPKFLNLVITGDERWFFEYDPETNRHSEAWHMPVSTTEEESSHEDKSFFFSLAG
jgi:hypothetical protein